MFAIDTFTVMQLDLNLLTALDALLEEGSVTGAAERLFLTPPAMSRTLGRIRRVTGDQILVRTGCHMSPTPHALAIRGDVHSLVEQAHAVLGAKQRLDLTSLERTFTLVCHDAITLAIGPTLVESVQNVAPSVVLRFLAEASGDTNDLRFGTIDLEIGSGKTVTPEVRSETVAEDHLVLVVRKGHPLAKGKMSVNRYAMARHITISRRGRLRDPIDDALADKGFTRRVVASAPTTTAALEFIRQSDLVAAVPSSVAGRCATDFGLLSLTIPLKLPSTKIILNWHRRNDTDLAHAWLREQTRNILLRMHTSVSQ